MIESFIAPVPSDMPDLVFYDAIVPVKMELELILQRLQNKWFCGSSFIHSYYHSIDSVVFDINTIATNCQLYNEAGSPLVQEAQQMRDELLQAITALNLPEPALSWSEDISSPIQTTVDSLYQKLSEILQPLGSVLTTPLPPYLVTYSTKLYLGIDSWIKHRVKCPRPLLWSDITFKKTIHYYCTLTEFYVCLVTQIHPSMTVE